MALFPFAFMTAAGRSKSLNAERVINLFPERSAPGSKSDVVLRSVPGNEAWSVVGTGPIRGWHDAVINNVRTGFAVSGNSLYEIDSDGAATLRGAAGTIAGTGDVSMASNANNEVVIGNSDGTAWVWDNTLLQALSTVDPDFGNNATNFVFLDQYILYARKGTGQVFASDLNNAKSWNPLSFGTAESAPDNVVELAVSTGQLWIYGEKTTEIFYNNAASPFAFSRIGGAVMQDIGAIKGTTADVDEKQFWLAQNGSVYAAEGIQPKRISSHAVEYRLKGRTGFKAWTYVDEGHAFYVLGTDQGAEVFDVTTGFWHERTTAGIGRYRANNYANVYGKHLVGDYQLGLIYDMNLEHHIDGVSPLVRTAISAPISGSAQELVTLSKVQLVFDMGVGVTNPADPGYDPKIVLDMSIDGGQTYGYQHWLSIGKLADFLKRAIWTRLGKARNRNLRIRYSEPTPYTIYGGALK